MRDAWVAGSFFGENRPQDAFLIPQTPPALLPNPIEMAFSKLKTHLRRIGARTFTEMFDAIAEVYDLYLPQECRNYFKVAGYI